MSYRELAVVPEVIPSKRALQIQKIEAQLKKYSVSCFNCGDADWGVCFGKQRRKYVFARKGWWFISARPEHNKRKCIGCGAKWLEKIGEFNK